MLFNFYENNINTLGFNERGYISPISNYALIFYKYKLLNTFIEDGHLINKIQVIPIRKNDLVFRGDIYILLKIPGEYIV